MTNEKAMSWIYQARRVATQNNAGGGAIGVELAVATGQIARIVSVQIIGPASNTTLNAYIYDEDNNYVTRLATIAAGVSRELNMPASAQANASHQAPAASEGLILASGQKLAFLAAAALQAETMTLAITLELFNAPTTPTWTTAGSAGTVALAASSISAANTLVAGRVW